MKKEFLIFNYISLFERFRIFTYITLRHTILSCTVYTQLYCSRSLKTSSQLIAFLFLSLRGTSSGFITLDGSV